MLNEITKSKYLSLSDSLAACLNARGEGGQHEANSFAGFCVLQNLYVTEEFTLGSFTQAHYKRSIMQVWQAAGGWRHKGLG